MINNKQVESVLSRMKIHYYQDSICRMVLFRLFHKLLHPVTIPKTKVETKFESRMEPKIDEVH